MGKRNPIARALRDPRYKARVVKSKKVYTRKGKAKEKAALGPPYSVLGLSTNR